MNEFDRNNEFDSQNNDNRIPDETVNEMPENRVPESSPEEEAKQNEVPAGGNTENSSEIPAEKTAEAPAENHQNPEQNPYFSGYGSYTQPDYRASQHIREYPYQNQGSRNPQQSNPQMNPQTPHQEDYRQYTPYNPQNRSYNGYTPYNPQNQQPHSQQYGQGQISYTPVQEKKKKQKKSSTGVVAVICAAAVILSGLSGFGGTMLANRLSEKNTANNAPASPGNSVSQPDSAESPVVIYRNVDEVATTTSTSGEDLTYSQVASIVKNSVVEIVTEFTVQSGWYQYVTQGAGSGVIISPDGYIITNTHVIADETTGVPSSQITVRLADGTEYPAKTIGYDSDSDISIIKIEATDLVAAQCGNSDNLTVGEELVIVGNPLGELGGTVTNGIVSATEREIQVNSVTMSLIQTNAAVNPGNSGGGMFNMQGHLVGIVNAKSSGSNIEGLGFAIPINDALEVSKQLLEFGYVRGKTMIGVSFEEVSGSNYFFYYNIEPGLYVTSLSKGYNDEVLKVGDRVVAVNGETVSTASAVKAIVLESSVGDKLKFQIERDGKLMEVEVTCYERVPTPVEEEDNIEFEETDEPEETAPTYSGQNPYENPFGGFADLFPDIFGGGRN